MPVHAECGKEWSGTRACHCSGCHETFSGVDLFDRHRTLHGEHGTCRHPSELRGVELRDGVWARPAMDEAAKVKAFGGRGR